MRTVAAVTVGRSDYSILLPVLREIEATPGLSLRLIAAGMHLSREFGSTVSVIEADRFVIAERVEMLLSSDTPGAIARSMGIGMFGFAGAYDRLAPDLLLLIGDRFEMLAAAVASLPFTIPIAHMHGGELTEGAVDDQIRHAITKMAHLHFVSTSRCAERVVQMGEEPWRVTVTGAAALDNLRTTPLLSRDEVERRLGLPPGERPLLVTYHPVTLESDRTAAQVEELVAALAATDLPIVMTYPNADTRHGAVLQAITRFAEAHQRVRLVENLGPSLYFSTLAIAAAMVGNSSSGIIEASSFKLPVVNIGRRQAGRERAANVVDVGESRDEIVAGIRRALSSAFAAGLAHLQNPYGDGHAAERIVRVLLDTSLDRLTQKRFHTAQIPVHVDPVALEDHRLV